MAWSADCTAETVTNMNLSSTFKADLAADGSALTVTCSADDLYMTVEADGSDFQVRNRAEVLCNSSAAFI